MGSILLGYMRSPHQPTKGSIVGVGKYAISNKCSRLGGLIGMGILLNIFLQVNAHLPVRVPVSQAGAYKYRSVGRVGH